MPLPTDIADGTNITEVNTTNWNALVHGINDIKDTYSKDYIFDVKHEDFGAVGDGNTDDTAAIQTAINAAYVNGGIVFFPPGIYVVSSKIGITLDSDQISSFPSLVGTHSSSVTQYMIDNYNGKLKGSIIKYTGTGKCIEFAGSSATRCFEGGMIRDLTIMNDSAGWPDDGTIGLHLKWCLEHRLFNVAMLGFNIGYLNDSSFSSDSFGITATHCVYGIMGINYFNAYGIFGAQLHQNTYGLLVRGGSGVIVKRATIEGCTVGIIIDRKEGDGGTIPSSISLEDIYSENSDIDFIIGADESKVPSFVPVKDIFIKNYTSQGGNTEYIYLNNVINVIIDGDVSGQLDSIITTDNSRKVIINSNSANYSFKSRSKYAAETNNMAIYYPYNLIDNGFTRLPSLQQNWHHPYVSQNDYGAVAADWFDYVVKDDMLVWKITLNDPHTPSNFVFYRLRTTDKMWGRKVIINARAKRDADCGVQIGAYDENTDPIGYGDSAVGESWTDIVWDIDVPDSGEYIDIAFVCTNTGQVRYLYVESIVATLDGQNQLQRSPMDYIKGLSGITLCDIAGTEITLDTRFKNGFYGVLATPQGNGTCYVVTDDDKFTIYTSADDINVAWFVIPRDGIM